MSNSKTIVRNTGWYGLESLVDFAITLFTSIAIARTLGPTKMGHIIYVAWISSMISGLGSMGVPETARKYMAEYLGRKDNGTARHIYFRTLALQSALATMATSGIVFWVLRDASAGYKTASVLIVLSIWPAMVNAISAQTNVATEDLSRNLPASAVSVLVFGLSIAATLSFHWGVIGVGASVLVTRMVDFLVRFFPTLRCVLGWDKTYQTTEGLRQRMLTFASLSTTNMILALVVWDRSEFILLKYLCPDIRQIAFYSVAFSMGERLLIGASIFTSASNATIFAQYGRDKSRLPDITAVTFRYLVLISFPLHIIASGLAIPVLLLLYGKKYIGATTIVALAPLLCMPKAFMAPVRGLLESTERQGIIVWATVLAGAIDVAVAWALIPRYGAVGAGIGSGMAQMTAVGLMWAICIHLYKIKLPWFFTVKMLLASIASALVARTIAIHFPPLASILLGGTAAVFVLLLLMYLTSALTKEDRDRLDVLTTMLPGPVARTVGALLPLFTRTGRGNAVLVKS